MQHTTQTAAGSIAHDKHSLSLFITSSSHTLSSHPPLPPPPLPPVFQLRCWLHHPVLTPSFPLPACLQVLDQSGPSAFDLLALPTFRWALDRSLARSFTSSSSSSSSVLLDLHRFSRPLAKAAILHLLHDGPAGKDAVVVTGKGDALVLEAYWFLQSLRLPIFPHGNNEGAMVLRAEGLQRFRDAAAGRRSRPEAREAEGGEGAEEAAR